MQAHVSWQHRAWILSGGQVPLAVWAAEGSAVLYHPTYDGVLHVCRVGVLQLQLGRPQWWGLESGPECLWVYKNVVINLGGRQLLQVSTNQGHIVEVVLSPQIQKSAF